ncbi:hypothetical protein E2C01_078110 [Portunus trituberculatus]|uniref:Uncharacterized protein n=1 Tax=Portunus trituberculatus TaxID=210409 RepID=A0A5B7ID50_PORTR|nr:hypothetical protein [Portunus trituberculatus]
MFTRDSNTAAPGLLCRVRRGNKLFPPDQRVAGGKQDLPSLTVNAASHINLIRDEANKATQTLKKSKWLQDSTVLMQRSVTSLHELRSTGACSSTDRRPLGGKM